MSNLLPYQERVIQEHSELQQKIEGLTVFINDSESPFKYLNQEEQQLLKEQLNIMDQYIQILFKRITNF
jgi:hypothetical protein